jgi:hypothetical protein
MMHRCIEDLDDPREMVASGLGNSSIGGVVEGVVMGQSRDAGQEGASTDWKRMTDGAASPLPAAQNYPESMGCPAAVDVEGLKEAVECGVHRSHLVAAGMAYAVEDTGRMDLVVVKSDHILVEEDSPNMVVYSEELAIVDSLASSDRCVLVVVAVVRG